MTTCPALPTTRSVQSPATSTDADHPRVSHKAFLNLLSWSLCFALSVEIRNDPMARSVQFFVGRM